MPLITKGKNGLPKLHIEPEIILRGRDDLVRVVNLRNETYVYLSRNYASQI